MEGKEAGTLKTGNKTVSLNEEDTVNIVLLNSLLELPEGQS